MLSWSAVHGRRKGRREGREGKKKKRKERNKEKERKEGKGKERRTELQTEEDFVVSHLAHPTPTDGSPFPRAAPCSHSESKQTFFAKNSVV